MRIQETPNNKICENSCNQRGTLAIRECYPKKQMRLIDIHDVEAQEPDPVTCSMSDLSHKKPRITKEDLMCQLVGH